MTGFKQMRTTVLKQLQIYTMSKSMLVHYDERGLHGRSTAPGVTTSGHADPTAKDALFHIEADERLSAMRTWVQAIEQAYAYFEERDVDKARLMQRLYGLNGCKPAPGDIRYCSRLNRSFHVSEATLYRWREDIVQAVMAAAIALGTLSPFEQ